MGDKSKIEWTDSTWNPVTGCTKVSAGCKYCYAERLWPRMGTGRPFTEVQCHPERLEIPMHWRKPRRIFVNSMSDLFHEGLDPDFIARVYAIMARCPQHQFQVLTKRPLMRRNLFGTITWVARVRDYAAITYGTGAWMPDFWPLKNVWAGVSVEDQATADERIPLLLDTPAALRFVSYEPALGPVDLTQLVEVNGVALNALPHGVTRTQCLDWVIAGGESGPGARPAHPKWFRGVRDQCAAAGVPFFFKQWGEWRPTQRRDSAIARDQIILEPGHYDMVRVGKRAAGRLLDGRTHDEAPE